jgi:cytochrome c5
MRIRSVWLYVFSLLLFPLVLGCSKSEAPKPPSSASAPAASSAEPALPAGKAVVKGETLFEQKCSQCHDLMRATSRTETKEKWAEIVKKMEGKAGAGISEADAEKILDYLVTKHKTAPQF